MKNQVQAAKKSRASGMTACPLKAGAMVYRKKQPDGVGGESIYVPKKWRREV
jgi:hypothetical protein